MTIETMAKAETAYGPVNWDGLRAFGEVTACGPCGVVGPTGQNGREGRSARQKATGLGGPGPLQQGTRKGKPPARNIWMVTGTAEEKFNIRRMLVLPWGNLIDEREFV